MTKKRNVFPQRGKCDVIKGILMNENLTRALNKKYLEDNTIESMVKKLSIIVEESTCADLKEKAQKAINLLEQLPQNKVVSKKTRENIVKEIC